MHDFNIWNIKKSTRGHEQNNFVVVGNSGTKMKSMYLYTVSIYVFIYMYLYREYRTAKEGLKE